MSAIIASTNVLCVQDLVGIIVCRSCKLGLPSERSASAHLKEKHRLDLTMAKSFTTDAMNELSKCSTLPENPLRKVYAEAPLPVSGSSYEQDSFYTPLLGIHVHEGFRCTLCPTCYLTEKKMRQHFSENHNNHSLSVDEQWTRCRQQGTVSVQTLFAGARTRFFPVSASPPIGELRDIIPSSQEHHNSAAAHPPRSSAPEQHQPPAAPNGPNSTMHFDVQPAAFEEQASGSGIHETSPQVQSVFEELNQALSANDSRSDIPSSMINPFIARTKFNIMIQDQGIDMRTAAQYSGLLGDHTDEESQVVQHVTTYLKNVPSHIPHIAPAVLQDLNLRGTNKEFTTVSNRSAERYARTFARIIISAIRLGQNSFLTPTVSVPLQDYRNVLRNRSIPQSQKDVSLHILLKSICLRQLEKMDSPRALFIRNFICLAAVIPSKSHSENAPLRYAQAKDLSPVLASLLYGASSCAITEVRYLGIESDNLRRNHPSGHEDEQTASRLALKHRLEQVLSSLHESNNSAASYIRKMLTIANTISRTEDVDFLCEDCITHPMCGVVNNVHIKMKGLGSIVKTLHKQIRQAFSSLLYNASLPPQFYSQIAAFQDILQQKDVGFSFLHHNNNKDKCRRYALWVFNLITNDSPKGEAFFTPTDPSDSANTIDVFGKKLRRQAVQDWLSNVQRLQHDLLSCIHLSSGSPGRSTELQTLQLFNTEHAPRNVYISQGRTCIVTRYLKTRSLTGFDRIIPRFPDPETSQLLLTYLVLFRTLESIFVGKLHGPKAMKAHMEALFVERGTSYDAQRIRDIIRAHLHHHGIPVEFNHIRHFAAMMVPIITQSSPALIREQLISDANYIAHLQAGHSAQVAEHNYARKPTDLPSIPASALARYRAFSDEWHNSMNLISSIPKPASTNLNTPSSPFSPPPPIDVQAISKAVSDIIYPKLNTQLSHITSSISSLKRSLPFSETPPSHRVSSQMLRIASQTRTEQLLSDYLPSLRHLMKNPNAMFTSSTQLHVAADVCDAREDLLVLMPTGAGKTMTILLPVFLEGTDCSTVILVPLAALVYEHVNKCEDLGITVATWQNRMDDAQVYVISVGHSVNELRQFFFHLQNKGRLRRIVIDEVHLIMLWNLFRSCISRLPYSLKSRGHYTQVVLLTATLPPHYRENLLNFFSIPSVILHSQPTTRCNLRFSVIDTSHSSHPQLKFVSHRKRMVDTLCAQVSHLATNMLQGEGGRILVFSMYKYEAENLRMELEQHLHQALGDSFQVLLYHGGLSSQVQKAVYNTFKTSTKRIIVVSCTNSFGSGVDVKNVRGVFHFGASNGLMEYIQEAGRAGRDGRNAECTVIYNKTYTEKHNAKLNKTDPSLTFSEKVSIEYATEEWNLMLAYLTQLSKCRKVQLYHYVDGHPPLMCIFDRNSAICDVCQTYQDTQIQESFLAPQSLPPSPTQTGQPSSPQPIPIPQNQPINDAFVDSLLGSPQLPPFQDIAEAIRSPQIQPVPTTMPLPSSQRPFHITPHAPSSYRRDQFTPSPPNPIQRRLNFTPSQRQPSNSPNNSIPVTHGLSDTANQFRLRCHQLQNICVPCLVLERKEELSAHACRNTNNRCLRCFKAGHHVSTCQSFNPIRANFCYGCSLSQVHGENIHVPGEFGRACFMGIARNIAWAFWNKDNVSQESVIGGLFKEMERNNLQQRLNNASDEQAREKETDSFFHAWLITSWNGLPNLVKLFLWWCDIIHKMD